MKRERPIPKETLALQAEAADPAASAWVSANAGSGKTHVLARRVVRLLLMGTDPSRILCLTYTKAAAANMAARVFRDLGRWATLDEAALAGEIAGIEGRPPARERLADARRLFARALETPGGLKVQTIHAFCEAVLHRFPLEANIAGHFEMLDGRMEQALLAEARRDLLAGAADGGDPALAGAFATVLDAAGESGLDGLLSEIVAKRERLVRFIDQSGSSAEPFSDLLAEFDLAPEEDVRAIVASAWPDDFFDAALAGALEGRAVAAGKATALSFAQRLAAACALADPAAGFAAAIDLFLTGKAGALAARSTKQILSKGVAEHFPDFADEFERACASLAAASDRLATLRLVERSRAALVLADRLIARYERLKSARGFLDFSDLITRTAHLLARRDVGPWVQYKLDQGIDHILVDEAQDTSPEQWRVVERLAEEFFTGARPGVTRTIFAVGDEKQSIYSFQGAEPEAFDIHRSLFEQWAGRARQRFRRVRLTHSFRSTQDVLSAVDLVFGPHDAREGLTRDADPLDHKAIRSGEPGRVEIWPRLEPAAIDEPDDWTQPVDHASAPAVRLAEIVAATIDDWIEKGEIIEGKGRKLTPGDVLVLVRKRDSFMHALSRSLKNRHVAVAGADRLSLRAHIAVKDLAALARFALQPQDDLSLAALMKSPVFGLTDDDLIDIAAGRPEATSLWSALSDKAATDGRLCAVVSDLARWRAEADRHPPFEFFAAILGRDGVRRRMIQRLGNEAGEILDEFLNFCLAAGKVGIVGLEAFLAVLEGAGPDIRREADQGRDEVRIMTVHAAKGLEAPVVILVDGGAAPFSNSHLPRLMPFASSAGLWEGEGFLWRSASDATSQATRAVGEALSRKGCEEYRRLLYVGMTRAEDRLIVCGYRGVRQPPPGTWYELVRDGLEPHCRPVSHPTNGLDILAFELGGPRAALPPEAPKPAAPPIEPLPPGFAGRIPPATSLPRPLAPSGAAALVEEGGEAAPAAGGSPVLDPAVPSAAIARGIAIHRLLQSLPAVPAPDRASAAARYLDRAGANWPPAERARVLRSVGHILADPAFAPVFSEGSRAEVELMGTLAIGGRERAVAGKIDRLAVTPERVLVVDYKTGRPVPSALAGVPAAHVAQLALYAALLRPLYPGREVAAALLYTEGPALVGVPADALAAALARLGGA